MMQDVTSFTTPRRTVETFLGHEDGAPIYDRSSINLTVARTVDPSLILALLAEFNVEIGTPSARPFQCALVLANVANYAEELARVLTRGIRPVIVSVMDGRPEDLAAAMDQGADDAVLGTSDTGEIIVRLHAAIRRSTWHSPNVIHIAGIEIEPRMRLVRRGEKEVTLSPTECALLLSVAKRRGDVVRTETLAREVWGSPTPIASVHTYVCYLRRKVDVPARRSIVRTVRGIGYALSG